MSELSLAQRFLHLSTEKANRPIVARRNSVPSLLRFLQSTDREIRLTTAEAIANLSDHPDNHSFLCHEKGFVSVVYDVYKEAKTTDPEVFNFLAEVFNNLRTVLKTTEDEKEEAENGKSVNDYQSARFSKVRKTRVGKGTSQGCRNIILIVNNLDAQKRNRLEELLQTTRGVVSYSVESESSRVTLYLSTPTATLLQLLEGDGFSATVEYEETNVMSPGAGVRKAPSYLGGEKTGYEAGFWKSLVVHGTANSLASRLERQKEEQNRNQNIEKSHIGTFVSKLTANWW
eukprot:Tbor_TRINITY_DN1986_c0_g1::TRINITY_DN1986_c0_g1_i1::g.3465::m.3465